MIIRYNIQDDNINTVLTSGSMVYAGTDTGLNIINLDNIERSFVTTPTPITCLVKNGNLIYAGSLDGVYEIDVETQVITNYFTSLYKQHISALAWAGGSLWIAYYNELNDSDTVDKVTKFDVTTQVSAEYLNTNYGNFNTTTGLLENGGKLYLFDNYCLTEMTLAGVITNTYYPLGTSKPEVNFKFDVYGNTLYMAIAIPANKELKITEFDLSLFTSVSTYSLYSEISNAPTHIENLVLAGNGGIAGDGTISGGLLVTSLYVPDGGLYKLMPNTCNVIDAATVFLGVFTSRQTWGALVSTSTTNELALTELTAVIGPQQVTGKSGNVYSTKQSGLVVKANAADWVFFGQQNEDVEYLPATGLYLSHDLGSAKLKFISTPELWPPTFPDEGVPDTTGTVYETLSTGEKITEQDYLAFMQVVSHLTFSSSDDEVTDSSIAGDECRVFDINIEG